MADNRLTMRRELMIPKAGDASIAVEFPDDKAYVVYRVVLDPGGGLVITPDGLAVGAISGGAHGDLPGGELHAVATASSSGDPNSNGFMSSVDKFEFDARTAQAGGLRIAERGEFAECAFGWVDAIGTVPGSATRMIANATPDVDGVALGIYGFRFIANGLQFVDATGLRYGARRLAAVLLGDEDATLGPDTAVVVINTTGAGRVLTLPGATEHAGAIVALTNASESIAAVSVAPGPGDELDGAGGPLVLVPGDSAWIVSAGGAGWRIHGRPGEAATASDIFVNPPSPSQLIDGIDISVSGPNSRIVCAIGTDNSGPMSVTVNIPSANYIAGAEIVLWAVDSDISITLNYDVTSNNYPDYVALGSPLGAPRVLTLRAIRANTAQYYWVPISSVNIDV